MEGSLEKENAKDADFAPALISVHPREKSVAVAVGSELRVFDLEVSCPVSLSDDSGGPSHSDAIRTISFGAEGKLFASAGDDKLVKIWTTDSWCCVRTVCSEKRVSAVAISHDGLFVIFADKFGVVWIAELNEGNNSQAFADKKAVPIFGHCCSTITRMGFSPDGRFIATADRDFKIRITVFPKRPLKGAHEIQSYCLGHTDFVTCLAFACPPDLPQGFLLSGSGDSTVRLWDYISGSLLHTCEADETAGLVKSDGSETKGYPSVTDICASSDGSLVSVAIESLRGVLLLKCDFSAKTLSVAKIVSLEDNFVPTSLGLSSSTGCLWMIMGASNIPSSGSGPLLACVRVLFGFQRFLADSQALVILEDKEVPGGEKLLTQLQGSLDVAEGQAALASSIAAVKAMMHNMLAKKQYSVEIREARKRSRNDKKHKP